MSRLRGKSTSLRSFNDVTRGRLLTKKDRGTSTVPLSKIVGSVDKPSFFTASFWPRSDELEPRWRKAYAVTHGLVGYHPIDLYQVGDDFFVVDGHFRVSVAKALGGDSISAHVEEWV